MHPRTHARLRWAPLALLAAAGAAVPAMAQDCRLSVTVADPILTPGETTAVNVHGRFPGAGYALASANFDVFAGFPGWSHASSGAIAGANVFGADFEQDHNPFAGIIPNPANPLRIWAGVYQPASYEPRLVSVTAFPTGDLSYYPSDLTLSTASCEPIPGRARILINPVNLGGASVVPGDGTTMVPVGDGLAISSDEEEVLIGLLLPAVQKVREAARRTQAMVIETETRARAGGHGDWIDIHSFTWTVARSGDSYTLRPDWPMAAGHEICQYVHPGIWICIEHPSIAPVPWGLPRLPDWRRMSVENSAAGAAIVTEFGFDEPVQIGGPDGPQHSTRLIRVRSRTLEPVELALGLQTISVRGDQPELTLTVGSPCETDFDGNGTVNSADISAFLTAWLASQHGTSWAGDFNGDTAVNSADISAFLTAWLDEVGGC